MVTLSSLAERLPHLTIRQKVVVGAIVPVFILTVLGVASFNYLLRLESTLAIMEMADDLSDTILEIRRYEKNFLLYGHQEDFEESQRFLAMAQNALKGMDALGDAPRERTSLSRLDTAIVRYQALAHELSGQASPLDTDTDAARPAVDSLRQAGKDLVDISLDIKHSERGRMLRLVSNLKRQLLVSGVLLLATGIAMALLLGHKILRALGTITRATTEIGQGNFTPLVVPSGNDETRRVLEAFNHMIRELERRQGQLLQERKMSSLGVLTSGIAHQLNNPLNNISTSCQILIEELSECDPVFAKRMLGNISQEVSRARDIVKGLLEFARAKDFSLKPTSLVEVVTRAMRLVSSQVPCGVALTQNIPADLVLEMDAGRMQEVFINLLINALQALPGPEGTVGVSAHVDAQAAEAVILVEDSGPGIPVTDLGRIFDPFFTTKEVGKGTGLGLSIVFGIIERHQGSIAAEDTGGAGARLVIRLPLQAGPEAGTTPVGSEA